MNQQRQRPEGKYCRTLFSRYEQDFLEKAKLKVSFEVQAGVCSMKEIGNGIYSRGNRAHKDKEI